MRQGMYPRLVFTKSGNLVAIATGSDACAEHECGSKDLMSAMTNQFADEETLVKALKKGRAVTYPSVLECKRVVRMPADQFQFVVVEGETPEAWLGLARHPLQGYENELQFHRGFSKDVDTNVAGAWDSQSFALRVRGAKYVKALKAFHDAMQRGEVVFAGTFLKRTEERLGGVILANRKFLSDEDLAGVATAQQDYESKLRLKARDDSRELQGQLQQLLDGKGIGYLWAAWSGPDESSVVYCLNPGYGIKAQYYGPYTRAQLLDWVRAKMAYELRPLSTQAA